MMFLQVKRRRFDADENHPSNSGKSLVRGVSYEVSALPPSHHGWVAQKCYKSEYVLLYNKKFIVECWSKVKQRTSASKMLFCGINVKTS